MRAPLVAASCLVLAFSVAYVARDRVFLPIDTQQILAGTGNLDYCLHHHIHSHCDIAARPVGPFPPAQYLLALAAKRLGASYAGATHLLLDTNALAALGVVVLLASAALRLLPRRLALLLVVVGVTGPLPWYAESGFAEALAMFLTLAAVASVALRWPAVVTVLAVLLAGLTKETAPLFLVPLAGTVLVMRGERLAAALPIVAPALAAALLNGGFNILRYGTFYNEYYSEPARLTPGVGLKAQFFAGQIAAPNAGLVWFWPAAALLLVAALILALRVSRRAALVLAGTTIALLGVFAAYHSPYGWNALGPRYLLPWVPALCLVAALLAAGPLERGLARHFRAVAAAALLVAVLALPQLGFFLKPLTAFSLFGDSRPPCYYVAPRVLEAYEHPNYYDCETHLGWGARPVLLEGLRPLWSPLGLTLAGLLVLTVGSAAAATRRPT